MTRPDVPTPNYLNNMFNPGVVAPPGLFDSLDSVNANKKKGGWPKGRPRGKMNGMVMKEEQGMMKGDSGGGQGSGMGGAGSSQYQGIPKMQRE